MARTRAQRYVTFVVFALLTTLISALGTVLPCTSLGALNAFYFDQPLAWGSVLVWYWLMVAGFEFVSWCSCGREGLQALVGFPNTSWDMLKMCVVGAVLYMLGPAFALPSTCGDAVNWNNVLRQVPYLAGFHVGVMFTYLDHPAINGLVLTMEDMHKYTVLHWTIISVVVATILGIAVWQSYLLFCVERFHWYAIVLFGGIGLFVLACWCTRKSHELHIHHFGLFGTLVPLLGSTWSVVTCAAMGICAGIFVEGIGHYGVADTFIKRHAPAPPAESSAALVGVAAAAEAPESALPPPVEGGAVVSPTSSGV